MSPTNLELDTAKSISAINATMKTIQADIREIKQNHVQYGKDIAVLQSRNEGDDHQAMKVGGLTGAGTGGILFIIYKLLGISNGQ